jgi:hypothetical protein
MSMRERFCIRILVSMALCLALVAFVLMPVPVDAQGNLDLPAPAFEQVGLYRLEVALLVFYGDLLLVTPVFTGLIHGRLPIEISARGAKFGQEADQSAELADAAIKELRQTAGALAAELTAAKLEIEVVKKTLDDNTQPGVISKR